MIDDSFCSKDDHLLAVVGPVGTGKVQFVYVMVDVQCHLFVLFCV